MIQFGYERGGTVTRIPRALRVLSSFADPFRRQTTVSIGCKLTMLETLRENKQQLAAEDEANSGIPCSEYGKIPINIPFDFIANTCVTALGLQLAAPLALVGSVAIESFDYSSGYVQILSDILYSQSKVGYLNAEEKLVVVDLSVFNGPTPVYDEEDIIDVSPIRSGDIPPDVVLVDYSYNRYKQPDPETVDNEDLRSKRDWEKDVTQGEAEYIYVLYNQGDSVHVAVHYPVTTSLTTYDELDRVLKREERSTTIGAKVNSAYVTELLEEGRSLGDNTGLAVESTTTEFEYAYPADMLIVPPENLAPCTYWYYYGTSKMYDEERDSQPVSQLVTRYSTDLAVAGSINLPTYFFDDGVLHPGNAPVPVESTHITFETDKAAGITKTISQRHCSYGMTQPGQQGLAKMAEEVDSASAALGMVYLASSLVSVGATVETHYDRYYGLQKRPGLADRKKTEYYKDPRESVSRIEFIQGAAGVGITTSYSVPWSPDDRIAYQFGSSTPYLLEASIAPELARTFGRVQQQLTYGHRMGFAVQMIPAKLPPYAASTATLHLGGIMAKYMINGQSWTFDSNGIIANVDMVYLGGVGSTTAEYRNPSAWAPVQDGITQMPIAPAISTNSSPTPANSIATPENFDPTSPGSIFTTLPTNTNSVFEKEVSSAPLVPPYQEVLIHNFTTFVRSDVTRTLISIPLEDRIVNSGIKLVLTAASYVYESRTVAPRIALSTSATSYVYELRSIAPRIAVGAAIDREQSVVWDIATGDVTPVAGSATTTTTPTGWTQIYSGTVDDVPLEVTGMPFAFKFNNVSYTSCWVSPNGYITFGSGSSAYSGLSASNPALPKIYINAMDDSMQKIYVRSTANTFRIRIEGNTNTGGSGTLYRVHEIAFFNPAVLYGSMVFEVRMGVMPETAGLFNFYSSSAVLSTDTATPAANKSWVYIDEDGTGTAWFILPASSITPVE